MNAALPKTVPSRHVRPVTSTATPPLPRGHLVGAKLKPPPSAAALVERPGLLAAVDHAIERRLLVVVAPTGSGKTTLLAQWRARAGDRPVAWLSIDEHDNNPRRFFSHLVAAVRGAAPGFDGYVTGALPDSDDGFPTAHITDVFLDCLGRIGHPLVLVLDDTQWLTDPEVLAAWRTLLRQSPPDVHWVIASRCVPDLPLGAFKLQDQLTVLGTAELNFQPAEVAMLGLQLHGRTLADDDAREIHQSTEGWVAGVKLALLTVDDPTRLGDAVRGFDGSHEAVAHYLADAVLRGQPADVREFLLVSSLVDKMSADLCNSLLCSTDAQAMLDRLERGQLFLHPLDAHRRFYRYHLLFQDFLRDTLARDHPERVAALHRTASGWFVRHEMFHEAMTHAFASGDRRWCVDVAGRCALHWLKHGDTPEILRWAEMLTRDEILASGDLTCAYLMSLILARRFGDATDTLRRARLKAGTVLPGDDDDARDRLLARLKVLDLMLHAETVEGPRLVESDLALDGDADFFAGLLMVAQTSRLLCLNEFDAMRRMAIRASAIGAACASPYLTSHSETLIGIADFMQGQLLAASRTCERNFEAHRQFHRSPAWVTAALGLACTHYEKSRLDDAQALLTEVLPFVSAASVLRNFMLAYALLARVKGLQGRHDEAFRLLDCAHSVVEQGGHPRYMAQICFEKIRLHIERDDTARAVATAREFGLLERARRGEWARPRVYEEGWARSGAALALLWLHEGRHTETRALLHILRDAAGQAGRTSRQMSCEMTLAMCHWTGGRPQAAYALLNRCIVADAQFAYARTAFDETPRMPTLLASAIGTGRLHFVPDSGYFAAFTGAPTAPRAAPVRAAATVSPLAEPLTDRELLILGLVAKGFCNKAISTTSNIALNTIKWHLRNAFTKLEVHSRTAAVARARELQLVD